MKNLSLRIRVFLLFCLLGLGSLVVTFVALWMGFRQLDEADALSAFVTSGIVAAFGILGLAVFIWLLFDENVSKPIEAIAANLRIRAHADVDTRIDEVNAQYLGDLAPAAAAINAALDQASQLPAKRDEKSITRLRAQRDQLLQILSDLPVATILATADHQIALYDGQAAALMERVGAARLKTSVFDYLEKASIIKAVSQLNDTDTSRVSVVAKAHCGEVYSGYVRSFGASDGYTLMLEALQPSAARPLTYDFELLAPSSATGLRDTPLRELVYVVFDSETTGLDPSVDEVVQLGAVRVVNGKTVAGETFESLVNPGIKIPALSTKVHGIDNDMVSDAPEFADVCTRFHDFSKDAVFVAHNAAFDMAFLHKTGPKIDRTFDHPVLDTVLMSAAVFGGSAVHTLDAICERLNITIPETQRHTAMGDAVATANALIAMIRICEGRGIDTFGALQAEANKHRRILQA